MPKSTAILAPNLGLFLTTDPLDVPDGGLQSGQNFRITDGKLNNLNIGWKELVTGLALNGPVVLCDRHYINGTELLMFATTKDLYFVDPVTPTYRYLTPHYVTGTASVATNAVTGIGTAWKTENTQGRQNAQVGDQISFGSNDQTSLTATWYTITAVGADLALTITGHTGTLTAGAYTIRQLFSNNTEQKWSTDIFTNAGTVGVNLWVGTNGVDPIVNWDGVTDTAIWGTPTFRAKKLKVYQNMMIYAAITEAGVFKAASMINSGLGDPNDFTPDSLFAEFVVGQGIEEIICLEPIGDNLVAYRNGESREGKATMIQFVGVPTLFIFRESLRGIGPIGQGLVANYGDYHEIISRDGMYRFDGVNAQLAGQQLWRAVLRSLDPARNDMAFTHFNQEAGEVVWAVPLTTDSDVGTAGGTLQNAYVEGYLEVVPQGRDRPWSFRSFPFISAGYTIRAGTLTFDQITSEWSQSNFRWNDQFFFADFPLSICGDANGKVWILDGAQNAGVTESNAGTMLPSSVTVGRRSLGDGKMMRALIRRVYAFVTQFTGLMQITTGLADSASGPVTTQDVQNFDMSLPEGGYFVSVFRRGRFFQLTFGTTGGPWSLSGYDVDESPGGRR